VQGLEGIKGHKMEMRNHGEWVKEGGNSKFSKNEMDVAGRPGKRQEGKKKQYNKQTKENNADAKIQYIHFTKAVHNNHKKHI
jgi:hypothetical protein